MVSGFYHLQSCHWCGGRGVKFGEICLVCAGAGFLVPNPRPYNLSLIVFANEIEPTKRFLSRLSPTLIHAMTQSIDATECIETVFGELYAELDRIKVSQADLDLQFPTYPPSPRR